MSKGAVCKSKYFQETKMRHIGGERVWPLSVLKNIEAWEVCTIAHLYSYTYLCTCTIQLHVLYSTCTCTIQINQQNRLGREAYRIIDCKSKVNIKLMPVPQNAVVSIKESRHM
jgi:hypothetical protein